MSDELKRQAREVCAAIENRIGTMEIRIATLEREQKTLRTRFEAHLTLHAANEALERRLEKAKSMAEMVEEFYEGSEDTPNPLAEAAAGLFEPPAEADVAAAWEVAEPLLPPGFPVPPTPAPRKPREWWATLYHPHSVCSHAGYMYESREYATGGYETIHVREILPGEEASTTHSVYCQLASRGMPEGMDGDGQGRWVWQYLTGRDNTIHNLKEEVERLTEELADSADVLVEARKSRDDYRERWNQCSKELAEACAELDAMRNGLVTDCVHCGETVADGNHWRTCERHPANEVIAKLTADNNKIHAAVCIANSDYAGLSEDLAVARDQLAGLRSDLAKLAAERDAMRQHLLDVENALTFGMVEVPIRVVERVQKVIAKYRTAADAAREG